MTDIASDDGAEHEPDAISSTPQYPYQPSLQHTNDGRSRPGTSTTGVSSTNRSPWMQSPHQGEPKLQELLDVELAGLEVRPRPYLAGLKVPPAVRTFHHSLHMHSSDR